jgi:hypothetical protein
MLRQLSEEHDLTPWFEDDELLAEVLDTVEGNTDPDDVPEAPEEPVTKPGDLWILGDHRLLCGDSTSLDERGEADGWRRRQTCCTPTRPMA